MPTQATLQMATEVREALAGDALTERQAKLYSQRLRRDMGQEGLASFTPEDVPYYLDEAMLLLQSALIERAANPEIAWRQGVKRAAEILEWLSQSDIRPVGVPMHLLSAAAYQLASYPAMALGHLRRVPADDPPSSLLRELLRADFPTTLEAVREFWRSQRQFDDDGRIEPSDLSILAVRHVVMAIGTLLFYFRTGEDELSARALDKLEKLAEGFLLSRDAFSYLLARLTAATCRRYAETSIWPQISGLAAVSTPRAAEALVQFGRAAFLNRRALVWPAQAAGFERLRENTSFVLCTPTGSGKTMVATLAIVQGLFAEPTDQPAGFEAFDPGSMVLYLVPSRALAAEVEDRLVQDLRGVEAEPVVVTGLYGGVDWGPTDAWIQTDRPTIVICTFEKADALIRYLGVLFLHRVRLVIIDEVHMVEQAAARLTDLEDGTSRAYRLEQLGTRLLHAQEAHQFRIVALSAVAANAAPAIARWVEGRAEAAPTTSDHRSTRQMLGRLEVTQGGRFTIRYDLMDGHSLRFEEEQRSDTPFVRSPFPPLPGGVDPEVGPEVAMRAPTLWAALHLAAEQPDGARPSVLISITQSIDNFASTCADLFDSWPAEQLPSYQHVDEADERWVRCLASAVDYFTAESVEYRLLRRGVAVHHGKMPGLLARRLKVAIDCGFVRVIIATSTLSEGVNIPINYLLLPSVYRATARLSVQEFNNLIGRVGRAGVSTEGHALVVLPERTLIRDRFGRMRKKPSRQWDGYKGLVEAIEAQKAAAGEGAPVDAASSPLAHLLGNLEWAWTELTGGGTAEDFMAWLEVTVVIDGPEAVPPAIGYLDSLDAFLLSAIQEVEELQGVELGPEALEEELSRIWRRTYAFASAVDEERLRALWLHRGRAIKARYPDPAHRRRIYRTCLSPRSAVTLINHAEAVKAKLLEGAAYAAMGPEERFTFVREVLALLSQVPSFRISDRLGRRRNFTDWPELLRWWLAKSTLSAQPTPRQVTTWYDFVAQNFIYRGAWGLGSILSLLLDETEDGTPIRALEIADWPRSGLPWIAFWLKEVILWGTLDPVAAFLLARGAVVDRPQAEADALAYYAELPEDIAVNDHLDPRRISDWVEARRIRPERPDRVREMRVDADLTRERAAYRRERLGVFPLDIDDQIIWIDPAGYTVARSRRPDDWPDQPSSFDFELVVAEAAVVGEPYLPHL